MTNWFDRRVLTTISVLVGAVMLQGCACRPDGQYAACAGNGSIAPIVGQGGGGNDGGGGMK
jgi:hypothetical protein